MAVQTATIDPAPRAGIVATLVPEGPGRVPLEARRRSGRDSAARTTSWRKAQQVFFHGDPAARYFEVVDGAVSAYVQLFDGRRQIVDFYFPGDIFGFVPGGRHLYTAEAVSDLTVRSYPASRAALATELDGPEMRLLFASTVEALHGAHARMLLLGRKHADERVASFLVQMADRLGLGPDGSIGLPMTRLDIADYLGLTIETVSRTFSELKRDGLIALPTSKHVILRRFEDLRELAGDGDFA